MALSTRLSLPAGRSEALLLRAGLSRGRAEAIVGGAFTLVIDYQLSVIGYQLSAIRSTARRVSFAPVFTDG